MIAYKNTRIEKAERVETAFGALLDIIKIGREKPPSVLLENVITPEAWS